MKKIIVVFAFLQSILVDAQNLVTLRNDSLFANNFPFAVISSHGIDLEIKDLKGQNLVTISEGGYHFENKESAWPETTNYSKEVIVRTLNKYSIFNANGIDKKAVANFVKQFPVKRTVLPHLRTSPISNLEE